MNKVLAQLLSPGVEVKVWESRSSFPDFYDIESYVEETGLIRATERVGYDREFGEAQFAQMLADAWHWEVRAQ